LAGRTIATAESCTAGMIAARLTDRPGSSDYVAGGVVSYSNQAKVELLNVDPALLEAHGAVSEPVAEAMAAGALKRFGADTAVATTGIAGPGGGSAEKPVGTVCFSVMLADGPTLTRTLRLPGNRSDVRERSTTVAMHLLRRALLRRVLHLRREIVNRLIALHRPGKPGAAAVPCRKFGKLALVVCLKRDAIGIHLREVTRHFRCVDPGIEIGQIPLGQLARTGHGQHWKKSVSGHHDAFTRAHSIHYADCPGNRQQAAVDGKGTHG